jgi:hypothetical protein
MTMSRGLIRTRPLAPQLRRPGIIGGRGINRSVVRSALDYNEAWTVNNIEPTTQGLSNRNIGVSKLNTSRLSTHPIRTIFKWDNDLYFVCNGDLRKVPTSGGVQTSVSASAFNASAIPSWAMGVSTSGGVRTDKIFICDGVNQPKTFDGSSLTNISAFGSDILTEIKTSNRPDKVIAFNERIVWGFPQTGVNKNYVLGSDLLAGETYTSGAGANNAWFEIVEGGNSYISAINSLKRAGAEKDNELLVVHKPDKSFSGIYNSSAGNNRFGVFTAFAQGLGAINQNCTLQFLNNIYTLSDRGIGGLSSVADEISATVLQEGIRVNPLIQEAAENADFSKAFSIHCPKRQIIWFFMPKDNSTTSDLNGITYPETPMSFTIGYKYALRTQTGEITDYWYTREGAGWGWSCSFVDGKDIYVGSYFGDIYKVFDGDEYERNPTTTSTRQPITSTFESGDMELDTGWTQYKEISDLTTHWYVDVGLSADFFAYWDEKDTGVQSLNKQIGAGTGASLWDVALWDVDYWTEAQNVDVNITPPDGGRSLRLKVEWDSEIDEISNHGLYTGLSGTIIDGGRVLRFK